MFRIKLLVVLIFVFESPTSIAQNRLPAFEMNERLGRGINMGNSFEAPTETAWGNPWIAEYFRIISELGFNHVRLPVRWEPADRNMEHAPYTINPVFLDRIRQVVEAARRYKLHLIVNMHHHDALYKNPTTQKERFLSQWYQIGNYFKDYSDSLLFEVLNEPHGNMTPTMWNAYFAEALAEIRKTNPTRTVLMGVADYGGLGGISKLKLPNDEYIILSPHYYNPFNFTHQGAEWVNGADAWLGTEWLDTEAERESVASEFNYALHFSKTNHIPIHVGEFGAYSKADIASRERWTTFLARWFEENNFSWAYWEFSAGFGIYNPANQQYFTYLVNALLHHKMPEPIPVVATPVYASDFSSGSNGWSLTQQGDASGNLSASSGKLHVSISTGGAELWHLQLVRNNLLFEKDKLYRISFTGEAQADRSLNFYAGKATSPWNSYGSISTINIASTAATCTFTFTMTNPTDPAARLVFDLGRDATSVTISNVKVEKLSLPVVTSTRVEDSQRKFGVYPNPVSSSLTIENLENYHSVELFDMTWRPIQIFDIPAGATSISFDEIPPGVYVLSLKGKGTPDKIRIIKE